MSESHRGTTSPPVAWVRAAQRSDEKNTENVAHLPSRLHPKARRDARRLERAHRKNDQQLAWRVQDILVGRGLTQADYSIAAGHVYHVPQVVSVVTGPPVGLKIRTLPGQMPEDFTAHTSAIAYHLGVADVRVVPLGPSLIRLELLPGPR
jgi:hypothetical protein